MPLRIPKEKANRNVSLLEYNIYNVFNFIKMFIMFFILCLLYLISSRYMYYKNICFNGALLSQKHANPFFYKTNIIWLYVLLLNYA